MSDKDQKFFNLSGKAWVLYALLAVLMIAGLMTSQNRDAPDWANCKESLIEQMFSDTCTPRRGVKVPGFAIPSSPGQNT